MLISREQGSTALKNPAIPRIISKKQEYPSPAIPPDSDIETYISTLIQGTGNNDHRIKEDSKKKLNALPTTLARQLRWDEAGLAAQRIYSVRNPRLMNPDELLDAMSEELAKNLAQVQQLETSMGKGVPGKITLGGLLSIPLETLNLKKEELGFIIVSIKKALIRETDSGNPNLKIMFPKYAPEVKEPKPDELSKAIAAARLNLPIGCCKTIKDNL